MKKIILFSITVILAFSIFISCNTEQVNQESAKIAVNIQKAEIGEITNTIDYSGVIEAGEQVFVTGKIPNVVETINFTLGDEVKEGDILYTVESTDIINNISLLEEQKKSAQSAVTMALNSISSAKGSQYESQLLQLNSNLEIAEITYVDAEKMYNDTLSLYQKGAVSEQQYTQAKSAYEQADISLKSAQESYDLFINKLSSESINAANESYKQAVSNLNSVEKQIENAKTSLEDTKVKSPINGIVSSENVTIGEMAGSTNIPFTIVNIDKVKSNIYVTEKIINYLSVGDQVNIKISSIGDGWFKGKVEALSPAADERTLTYQVEISIDNKDHIIKPGMFANVTFTIEKTNTNIVLPRSSVLSSSENYYVFVEENGKAVRKDVTVGIDNGINIEILEGLEVNENIIVVGQNYVSDGSNVNVISKEGE